MRTRMKRPLAVARSVVDVARRLTCPAPMTCTSMSESVSIEAMLICGVMGGDEGNVELGQCTGKTESSKESTRAELQMTALDKTPQNAVRTKLHQSICIDSRVNGILRNTSKSHPPLAISMLCHSPVVVAALVDLLFTASWIDVRRAAHWRTHLIMVSRLARSWHPASALEVADPAPL
jgi:hypothetical protein